jgi:hypothetical protein
MHSAKRIVIIKSNSQVNRKITFLAIYNYFSGKRDLNQRIPLLLDALLPSRERGKEVNVRMGSYAMP